MTDDLLGILTGGKETSAPAVDPTDYLVRTVYGEADPNDPQSRQAVAAVIVNRAKKSGQTFDRVVQEPGQFEPWADPKARARMLALDPNSADYKSILADVQPVIKGDVSLPYDAFYSPSVLKTRGQQPPAFDDGSGRQVGSQLFFTNGGGGPDLGAILGGASADDKAAEDAYAKAFGSGGAAPGPAGSPAADLGPATIKVVNGKIVFGDTGQPVPDPQAKTITTLVRGNKLSADATPGAVNLPWVQRNPNDQFKPGEFYIEAGTGQLKQVPGGAPPANAGFGGGVMAGLGDIPNSLFKLFPGHSDSDVYNAAEANRLIYDATHQGDGAAQTGRLVGQIAGSAPLLVAGEGALGSLASRYAPEAVAPVLDFLAGNGGKAVVENGGKVGGNLLMRGLSLGARGAGEGAGAAALTSASSDRPLAQQIAIGAGIGGPLGIAAPAVGAVASKVSRLAEPFSETGRNKLVDRFILDRAQDGPTALDLTEHVQGSTPTLAQASANPGLATLERGVKSLNPSPFDALARSNQQARELAVDAVRGDRQSLDDLIAARATQTDPLREAAFANTKPVDPTPVLAKIDQILASPAGQRDVVASTLGNIRAKLVDGQGAMQTDPEQLWGVRSAINDLVSPLAAGTKNDGRLATRELLSVRDAMDPVIEAGAPGFRGYLKAYSEASRGVDAQEYLQSLKLADSQGHITLGRVDNALTRIEAARTKGGANPAKSIPDETMQSLYALRSDLRRQANSDLGRGSGSDTYQKLATGSLVDTLAVPASLGVGLHGPLAGAALSVGKLAYGAKNRQLMDLLTAKLIDPSLAPALDRVHAPSASNRLLTFLRASAAKVPATGAAVAGNNLLSAQ